MNNKKKLSSRKKLTKAPIRQLDCNEVKVRSKAIKTNTCNHGEKSCTLASNVRGDFVN